LCEIKKDNSYGFNRPAKLSKQVGAKVKKKSWCKFQLSPVADIEPSFSDACARTLLLLLAASTPRRR
jgi:hypothetical protein